jgi:hypothetical protein
VRICDCQVARRGLKEPFALERSPSTGRRDEEGKSGVDLGRKVRREGDVEEEDTDCQHQPDAPKQGAPARLWRHCCVTLQKARGYRKQGEATGRHSRLGTAVQGLKALYATYLLSSEHSKEI